MKQYKVLNLLLLELLLNNKIKWIKINYRFENE